MVRRMNRSGSLQKQVLAVLSQKCLQNGSVGLDLLRRKGAWEQTERFTDGFFFFHQSAPLDSPPSHWGDSLKDQLLIVHRCYCHDFYYHHLVWWKNYPRAALHPFVSFACKCSLHWWNENVCLLCFKQSFLSGWKGSRGRPVEYSLVPAQTLTETLLLFFFLFVCF